MMMKGLGLDESISNLTSTLSGEISITSNIQNNDSCSTTTTTTVAAANNTMLYPQASSSSFASMSQAQPSQPPPAKKKRGLPGNPDPDAEVIALSPKSLLATNRFICEVCKKGFQRDQNLQLHRRGHNLPWKLKQRADKDQIKKKVYVCPEPSCVHHDPSRALGDLTGIKKHFCRKHGEKKWKCEKCSKNYAVQSDWKAHSKVCGTREYKCDCGTLFSRRDSFITHRAFCDALAEESSRAINPLTLPSSLPNITSQQVFQSLPLKREQDQPGMPPWLAYPPPPLPPPQQQPPLDHHLHHLAIPSSHLFSFQHYDHNHDPSPSLNNEGPTLNSFPQAQPPPQMSATALLQKAADMGVTAANDHHQQQHDDQLPSQLQDVILSREGASQTTSSMLHDVMMMTSLQSTTAAGGFDGGTGFLDYHHHQGMGTAAKPQLDGGRGGSSGGGDGLTRDFLGLRTFSHKDFLNMAAGFGHMSSSSASFEQRDHHNQTAPW